jgi:hypothetical protein
VAFLTWDGRIGLADTVRLIERIDDERLAGPEDDLWNGWEDVITLLGLRPLAPRVEAAFKDGRISPEMDDIKDFYRRLGAAERDPQDKERFEAAHVGYLDDILRVLSLFKSEGRQNYVATDDSELPVLHDPFEDGAMTNPFRHVGRNDPCPCGSGKKFKKCCLNA